MNPPPKPAYCIGRTEGCATAENVVNLGCTKGICQREERAQSRETRRQRVSCKMTRDGEEIPREGEETRRQRVSCKMPRKGEEKTKTTR